jgi:hypothetical protein
MKSRILLTSWVLLAGCHAEAPVPRISAGAQNDINSVVLRVIAKMPQGGKYAANAAANQLLAAAIHCAGDSINVQPDGATPSYCSGATYLVFLGVLQELARAEQISISRSALDSLPVAGNHDGEGVWGRWNANGPGTARLFAETGLGKNFTAWDEALPGDFLKLWWNEEIGHKEKGHSVIFLGREQVDGVEHVRFWSSNIPDGYGVKVIPKSKIARALFSRLDRPARINSVAALPPVDDFLASMLKRSATQQEVNQFCNVRD